MGMNNANLARHNNEACQAVQINKGITSFNCGTLIYPQITQITQIREPDYRRLGIGLLASAFFLRNLRNLRIRLSGQQA